MQGIIIQFKVNFLHAATSFLRNKPLTVIEKAMFYHEFSVIVWNNINLLAVQNDVVSSQCSMYGCVLCVTVHIDFLAIDLQFWI